MLQRGIHLKPAHSVYQALPRLAADHPQAAVEVLRLMVKTDDEGWSLYGYEAEVRETLTIALNADSVAVRDDARTLTEIMIARGSTSFRELVAAGGSSGPQP